MKHSLSATIALAAMIGFCLLQSCYYDKAEFLYPDVLDCSTATYTFTKDVQPLITLHCSYAGCHDPSTNAGNVTLTSYAQATASASRINERVVVQKTMPPGGGLTSSEISMIKCWIANKTPQ